MINPRHLKAYPICALDKAVVETISEFAESQSSYTYSHSALRSLALLNMFCDITDTQFTAVTLNRSEFGQHISRGLIGFIYTELVCTEHYKQSLSHSFFRTLSYLQGVCNIVDPPSISVSTVSVTDDVKRATKYYKKSFAVNQERKDFYQGWFVEDNEGNTHWLNLIHCHRNYGGVFTGVLHTAFSAMAIRTKRTTLANKIHNFNGLVRTFILLFSDIEEFNVAMSTANQHTSIATVYDIQLLQAKSDDLSLKSFHQKWREKVAIFYEVFIHQALVPEPLVTLLAPDFKVSGQQEKRSTNVKYSVTGNAFNDKLITQIPLSYSDYKVKEAIFEAIKIDIKHVAFHCRHLVEETLQRYDNFNKLQLMGQVKRKTSPGTTGLGRGSNPVDMTVDENVCATYAHYGWNPPGNKTGYVKFLGYVSRSEQLHELLCLPTPYLLYPFLLLLIEQHPAITDSWLVNWELYNKQGRLNGVKQVKGTWVAVSEKSRKGQQTAQQTIVLNDVSKRLVEQIIQLTTPARDHLRSQNNGDYRAVLLSQNGVHSQPIRITKLLPLSNRNMERASVSIRVREASMFRNCEQSAAIFRSLSCSTMRASCGVRVYLETQSVHAMAEALGHEKYNPNLISHYLPKPLWDYFTNRWVRLFQNAIVYEAMKDSRDLFNAIDISEDELETFLKNHGLGELPHHIKTGKIQAKDVADDDVNNLCHSVVVMLSTGLLQVLFAIVKTVEKYSDGQSVTALSKQWYDTASFILSHLATSMDDESGNARTISRDVMEMYLLANRNPLEQSVIQRALVC